jgi:molybdopterin-binding protein
MVTSRAISSGRPHIALALAGPLWFGRDNASIRGAAMKISARNRLKGKIVEVRKGATTAHVRLDIGGTIVTASITNEAVEELGLKAGGEAYAIVKASDVMIGLDD